MCGWSSQGDPAVKQRGRHKSLAELAVVLLVLVCRPAFDLLQLLSGFSMNVGGYDHLTRPFQTTNNRFKAIWANRR